MIDLKLPDVDGLTLLQQLKSSNLAVRPLL